MHSGSPTTTYERWNKVSIFLIILEDFLPARLSSIWTCRFWRMLRVLLLSTFGSPSRISRLVVCCTTGTGSTYPATWSTMITRWTCPPWLCCTWQTFQYFQATRSLYQCSTASPPLPSFLQVPPLDFELVSTSPWWITSRGIGYLSPCMSRIQAWGPCSSCLLCWQKIQSATSLTYCPSCRVFRLCTILQGGKPLLLDMGIHS